jgi:hypothetical protein
MHYPRSPVAVGDGGLQPSAVWAVRHQRGADDSIPAWPAARTFQLLTPAVVGRITAWWAVLLAPDSTDPSPCGRSGGLPPAQPHSAATPASRHSHRPHLLRPGGASSPPWPATAGPAPPLTARCHAPDTAGHRGCRTAARGCGRPGSANRRSAGCTERNRRAAAGTVASAATVSEQRDSRYENSPPSSRTRYRVRLRRLPVPTRCDCAGGPLVAALRPVLSRCRGTARRARDRGRPRHRLSVGAAVHAPAGRGRPALPACRGSPLVGG